MTKTIKQKTDAYQAANREAARIIAADPERYPGLMQEWADMVLDRATERTKPETGRAV